MGKSRQNRRRREGGRAGSKRRHSEKVRAKQRTAGEERLENLGLAVSSAILLAAPFLLSALWFLHYVALVPWVILITRTNITRSWLYFLVGYYVFFAMAMGPFSLFHKALPFAVALFYAPLSIPFAVLLRRIHQHFRLPLTLLVPVLWAAVEWLRIRLSVGATPVFPVGTSQFGQTWLIQIADVTGVAGISFVVATASGAVADLLAAGGSWSRKFFWPVAGFPALLLAVLVYGAVREREIKVIAGPRLALIQPNATHYKDPATVMRTFREQLQFTREEIAPGSADLIVWPENAVSVPFDDDTTYQAELAVLGQEQRARLLLGAVTRASANPPRIFTSAYYLSEGGEVLGRYDKLHLIPWAEYIPFEPALSRLSPALSRAHHNLARSLLGYTSFGQPGETLSLFSIEREGKVYRFAAPICFEVAGSGFAREATREGADFLVNITSEGLFGPPVYNHMMAHSIIRAVENRIPVVRAGNHGISGFIDPAGRPRQLVRGKQTGSIYLEAGALVGRVPINARGAGSFYSRFGDLFAYLCIAASLTLFALTFVSEARPRTASADGT